VKEGEIAGRIKPILACMIEAKPEFYKMVRREKRKNFNF